MQQPEAEMSHQPSKCKATITKN